MILGYSCPSTNYKVSITDLDYGQDCGASHNIIELMRLLM